MQRGTLFCKVVTTLSFSVSPAPMPRWQRRATNKVAGFPTTAGQPNVRGLPGSQWRVGKFFRRVFGTISDQITAQPHVQWEIARIQALRNYRYNSLPHARSEER